MRESVRSLRWSWIGFGWFIAVAIISLIMLSLAAFDIVGTGIEGETAWIALAMVVGFFISGFFVGTRVVAAPVLHGAGMAACSLLAWVAINLVIGTPMGETTWRSLDPLALIGLLILQLAASTVGARMGVRWMRAPA